MFIGSPAACRPVLRKPSTGWSPRKLGPLLVGWFHPADAKPDAWVDRISGASFTAIGAPVVGGRMVEFGGLADAYEHTGIPAGWPTGAAAGEMWVRARQDALPADASARGLFGYGGITSATDHILWRGVASGVNRLNGRSGGVVKTLTASDLSGAHTVAMLAPSGSLTLRADGAETTTSAATHATASTRARIGAFLAVPAAFFWHGGIGEVLVIAGATTASQRAAIDSYLSR